VIHREHANGLIAWKNKNGKTLKEIESVLSGITIMQVERMMAEKINISEKFGKLPAGDYAVGVIAKMNDYEFKIVKFKGDFLWHSHPDTDETFIIIEGTLVMNFHNRKVEVQAGEMIVIPKGVEHKPSSENGYKALLIEPEGVPNTGDVQNEMTIAKVEWV
jgi:mannose-6-phosphate isomerase-like protein (cupin superfamily)